MGLSCKSIYGRVKDDNNGGSRGSLGLGDLPKPRFLKVGEWGLGVSRNGEEERNLSNDRKGNRNTK